MAFTLTDKVLLDRAARMINGEAKALRVEFEAVGWAVTEAGRKAKQEYDRLLRDERDLRALGKRLCAHFDVKAAPRGAAQRDDDLGVTGAVAGTLALLSERPADELGRDPDTVVTTVASSVNGVFLQASDTVGGLINPVTGVGGRDVGF